LKLSEIQNLGKLDVETNIGNILTRIHIHGPVIADDMESLSFYKQFYPEITSLYEGKINSLLGLFYKPLRSKSLLEEVYSIYADAIRERFGRTYTPVQAEIITKITRKRF